MNNFAVVISGFPGIGKSYAQQNFTKNKSGIFLDSDSSNFSWVINTDGTKVRNSDFPKNYIEHIQENMNTADIICVSAHKPVLDALNEYKIPHVLVYPAYELKDEYLERYKKRGSSAEFIKSMSENWQLYIRRMVNDICPNKIQLSAGQYLKDVMDKICSLMNNKNLTVIPRK